MASTMLPLEIFAAVPWLNGLQGDARRRVELAARRRGFGAGETVFRQDEGMDGLFLIEEGWFKVVKSSADGREQTLRVLGPGEAFNSLNLFVDTPNPATVEALEAAVVWHIPGTVVGELLHQDPGLAWGLIRHMAHQLQHLTELVADLSLRTVEARLARLLLEEAEDGVLDRHRWATQAEIAARVGTVTDVVNRALRNFVSDGLIYMERRKITLLDTQALRDVAKAD